MQNSSWTYTLRGFLFTAESDEIQIKYKLGQSLFISGPVWAELSKIPLISVIFWELLFVLMQLLLH